MDAISRPRRWADSPPDFNYSTLNLARWNLVMDHAPQAARLRVPTIMIRKAPASDRAVMSLPSIAGKIVREPPT
jgi:hypothetical protein